MLKSLMLIVLAGILSPMITVHAQSSDANPFYEMRIYYAAPGKLDELHSRFRNHTLRLFEKHGMVNVGYWVPVDNSENKLIFVLAYPSAEAREKSWEAFVADPEWQAAYKASHANGKLVDKAESIYLTPTDYSPVPKPSTGKEQRLFELRTYKATPGNLDKLNARFRNHTMKLFSKHGMTHIGYWVPVKEEQGKNDTLIYILAHKDKEAAQKSFDKFRADPDWNAAKSASEVNGSLTVKVDSLYMVPTDYSRIK